MHRLIFVLLASILLQGSLDAQNRTVGCGVVDDDEVAEFSSLFTADDSAGVIYRRENNLQRVSPPEIVAVPDSATCERLAERATELLQVQAWDYWSKAEWVTYSVRVGPYYYVYVAELLPPEWVGGGSYSFVLDATTLEEIPTPFASQ
jgi:hypothetical protein